MANETEFPIPLLKEPKTNKSSDCRNYLRMDD